MAGAAGSLGSRIPEMQELVRKGTLGGDAYGQRGFANRALISQTVETGTEGPTETTDPSHFSSESPISVSFEYWKH